jgi:hypothetical protein
VDLTATASVAHNHKLYQIENHLKALNVMVPDRLGASVVITYQDRPLRVKEITVRPVREKKEPSGVESEENSYTSPSRPSLEGI